LPGQSLAGSAAWKHTEVAFQWTEISPDMVYSSISVFGKLTERSLGYEIAVFQGAIRHFSVFQSKSAQLNFVSQSFLLNPRSPCSLNCSTCLPQQVAKGGELGTEMTARIEFRTAKEL
jgi:hypothetical protein